MLLGWRQLILSVKVRPDERRSSRCFGVSLNLSKWHKLSAAARAGGLSDDRIACNFHLKPAAAKPNRRPRRKKRTHDGRRDVILHSRFIATRWFIAATALKPPPTPPTPSGGDAPVILSPPANVSAYLNDRVEFKCGVAKKDDAAHSDTKISWRSRELGDMPRVGHHHRFTSIFEAKITVHGHLFDKDCVQSKFGTSSIVQGVQNPFLRRVHKNGSLIFRFVNKRDEGWYGCEAEDSKGHITKSDFVRLLVEGTELRCPQSHLGSVAKNKSTNESLAKVFSILCNSKLGVFLEILNQFGKSLAIGQFSRQFTTEVMESCFPASVFCTSQCDVWRHSLVLAFIPTTSCVVLG